METCDSEMSQIARSMDSSSSDMLQIAWKMYAAKNHEFEVNKTYHIFFATLMFPPPAVAGADVIEKADF